ncbi:MAG TPA: hypothetical protein VGV67_12350 [Solirubrobacteraceae bacterium]|nr:hypothetical protein [Solirubrobacteraceae bacterium]
MPDRPENAQAQAELRRLVEDWREALGGIERDASAARPLVDQALGDASAADEFHDVAQMLRSVSRRATRVAGAVDRLATHVRRSSADWEAERRYDPGEVHKLRDQLAAEMSADPGVVARRWVGELFDALDSSRWDVVEVLDCDLGWPEGMRAGAQHVRSGLAGLRRGDYESAVGALEALGRGGIEGFEDALTPALRSRANRLAAWIALRRLADRERALRYIDQAVEVYPRGGRMQAERAAYFLFVGDFKRAAADAQAAIELASGYPAGYLELGIWAELTGDFSGADDLYRRGLDLMPTFEIARLHTRAALLDPPGRLLLAAAQRLLELGQPDRALEIANEALMVEVRGPDAHPEADVHRVRSRALEASRSGSDREAAVAAMEAGRLYLWNNDLNRAVDELARANQLDESLAETGWLLADALLSTSFPLGETLPNQGSVSGARDRWDSWSRRVGQPRRETSWAYLTRAIIEDLITQRPGADRRAGVWVALTYVERALIHDEVDAQRWGFAAQYLRYARLEELAFEAVSRGYELSTVDRQVLAERLPLLANQGDFVRAESAADELVQMYGHDPWVDAVRAWLAMHRERFDQALALLELPIAEGSDPAWYYDMQALCHLALGDVEAARAAYGALRDAAPPVDGSTKCRLATANIVLHDHERAAAWLRDARDDETTPSGEYLVASALAALAADDHRAATEQLRDAVAGANSAVEATDITTNTRRRAAALGDGEPLNARQATVAAVEREVVAERIAALEADPPTPDAELREALHDHDRGGCGQALGPAETALLAVAARRQVHAGELDDAISTYERLRESSLEPEATLALTRTLRDARDRHAAQGAVDDVKRICARLAELGATTPVDTALAVADALRVAGRLEEAREHVAPAVVRARDDAERLRLERRLGALSVELGDLAGAEEHFRAALTSASASDGAVVGQVELRLAVVARLAGNEAAATAHLQEALRAWAAAGALDAGAALLEELRGLREREWSRVAAEALDWIESTLADNAAPHRLSA